MISLLRSMFDSWIGRVVAIGFIVLIGIAFALADVTGSLGGGASGSGTVAEVGDLDVPAQEYAVAIDSGLRLVRQQNPDLDMGSFVRQGGADGVFNRLLDAYAISAFAEENGIWVSKAMVDSKIATLPGAMGGDNKFNAAAYQSLLADAGITDEQFRDDMKRSFLSEQLLPVASYGVKPSQALVSRYAAINFETRKGTIAALPSEAFIPKEDPSDAELNKYYAANRDDFTDPEQRAFSYAFFTPDIVGDAGRPTDAEIAAYYNDNKDEFGASKAVRYEQLVLPGREEAQKAYDRVKGGETLAAVAKDMGFAVSEESASSEDDLAKKTSRALAATIYAAGKGDLTQPAEGEFGYVVARIKDVDEQPARTLAQARDDIYKLLAGQKSVERLAEITDDMQDRLDGGESVASVAKSYDLSVKTTPPVIQRGIAPKNPVYKMDEKTKALLPTIFQMDANDPGRLTEAGEGGYALVAVKEVKPAAPPALAEIRPRVIAAWKLEQGSEAAKKAGDKVMAKVRDGSSLTQAVASLGVRLPRPEPISSTRQELAERGQNVPPALFALFQIPEGKARMVPVGQDRGYLLLKVDDVIPAKIDKDDKRLPQFARQYAGSLIQELQRQFVAAMRKDVGVKINEDERRAVVDRVAGDN